MSDKSMRELRVNALRQGTVLDHLEAGTALRAHRVLSIPPEAVVTIGINLPSRRLGGVKDIIKVENHELSPDELNRLALLSPRATVVHIREYQIVRKTKVEMPETFGGLARCANPGCITNHEPVRTRFHLVSREPVRIRCHYCERVMRHADLEILP